MMDRRATVLLVATLLLAAFNTRTVIASVAPLADVLRTAELLDTAMLTVVGTLAPLCFAVFAAPAPALTRLVGLECAMGAALAAITLGHAVRAFADTSGTFAAGTAVALAGVGMANVLLPPLVRRYFSFRVGLLTALYVTAQSLGTGTPPLVAVPIDAAFGWRAAMGLWAVVGAAGLIAWAVTVRQVGSDPAPIATGLPRPLARNNDGDVWRSPTAWAIAALFGVASSHAYAAMAWLPAVVSDLAGVGPAGAGALLSIYGGIGIVPALLLPFLARRVRDVGVLVHGQCAVFLIGYLGLILVPRAAVLLWVVCLGLGVASFALCLLLVNLRTRTHAGAVRLSSFVQGVGYSVGALGPLLFGMLGESTGGWRLPLILLGATAMVAIPVGFLVRRPVAVEEEWHGRHRRGGPPSSP